MASSPLFSWSIEHICASKVWIQSPEYSHWMASTHHKFPMFMLLRISTREIRKLSVALFTMQILHFPRTFSGFCESEKSPNESASNGKLQLKDYPPFRVAPISSVQSSPVIESSNSDLKPPGKCSIAVWCSSHMMLIKLKFQPWTWSAFALGRRIRAELTVSWSGHKLYAIKLALNC